MMAAPITGRLNVRWKHYTGRRGMTTNGVRVRAVKITEKNLTDIVAYISKHGGAATGHLFIPPNRRARIRIRQLNYGYDWGKRDWRVAELGDYIVQREFEATIDRPTYVEFMRVKASEFDTLFKINKK